MQIAKQNGSGDNSNTEGARSADGHCGHKMVGAKDLELPLQASHLGFKNVSPLEDVSMRVMRCPSCLELETGVWKCGKIWVLPHQKQMDVDVFMLESSPHLYSFWICDDALSSVKQQWTVRMIREYSATDARVIIVPPCPRKAPGVYRLYTDKNCSWAAMPEPACLIREFDPRSLKKLLQFDIQEQETPAPDLSVVD